VRKKVDRLVHHLLFGGGGSGGHQGQTGIRVSKTGISKTSISKSGISKSGISETGVSKTIRIGSGQSVQGASIGVGKSGGSGDGQGSGHRDLVDGSRSLLGGQTTGGSIIKSSLESGLGFSNSGVIGKILATDLGSLLGGKTSGNGIVKSSLEGGLGGGDVGGVVDRDGGSRGASDQICAPVAANKGFIQGLEDRDCR